MYDLQSDLIFKTYPPPARENFPLPVIFRFCILVTIFVNKRIVGIRNKVALLELERQM
jgi:hypothetical protein